jgi:D-alanyl-D-alanine carboxypeptidase
MPTSRTPAGSQDLQKLLDAAVSEGIPGLSAALATSAGVMWSGTAGYANIQTGEPVRPDTLFGIGSITKTLVAVVVLQLVEEKRLRLEDTPSRVLGSAVDGIANADKATLAQLLSHTSGIPSWELDAAWIRNGRGASLDVNRLWGKNDTLPYLVGHGPIAPPGEKYSYSNTNYTLLGMVIEKVTENDMVREFHQRILMPCALTEVFLEGFESLPRGRLPRRYHWATPEFRRDAGIHQAFPEVRAELIDVSASNLSVEWAAGGVISTARDLAWYGVLLRDGRLLDQQSMRFMMEWFPVDENRQVGHNVFRVVFPSGVVVIGHNGSVLGFSASLYWIEGADMVVAVMCNVGAMHSGKSARDRSLVGMDQRFVAVAHRVNSRYLCS